MLKKALIFAVMAGLNIGFSANAETPCEMVDKVLQTVSVVRDVELDISDKYFTENIGKLEALTENISLAVLIPQDDTESFASEKKVMFQYLSTIREAAAGGASGYNNYAKETLNIGMTASFSNSLTTLSTYWDCRPEEKDTEEDAFENAEYAKKTGGRDSVKIKSEGQSDKPGPRAFDASEQLNNRLMEKAQFDGGAIFKGDTLMFILMMSALALGGLVVYVQKRAKTYREREARKLLNKAIKVRLGKKSFEMNVVDISMSGAKIGHPGVIEHLGKISLYLDGRWHAGQIKWCNSAFAGVKFRKPLDAETVALAVED